MRAAFGRKAEAQLELGCFRFCPRLFSNRGGRVKFSNRGGRVKLGLKLAFAGVMVLSGVGCPPHDGCQGCDAARCEAI